MVLHHFGDPSLKITPARKVISFVENNPNTKDGEIQKLAEVMWLDGIRDFNNGIYESIEKDITTILKNPEKFKDRAGIYIEIQDPTTNSFSRVYQKNPSGTKIENLLLPTCKETLDEVSDDFENRNIEKQFQTKQLTSLHTRFLNSAIPMIIQKTKLTKEFNQFRELLNYVLCNNQFEFSRITKITLTDDLNLAKMTEIIRNYLWGEIKNNKSISKISIDNKLVVGIISELKQKENEWNPKNKIKFELKPNQKIKNNLKKDKRSL